MRKKFFSALASSLAVVFTITSISAAPLYGDLNSDGRINSTDYATLNRHVLGISSINDIFPADLNGDGRINSTDYALLRRYLMGIILKFPVEELNPVTPTPDPNGEDAWKNNTGTIKLGNTITVSGTGVSVNGSVVNITSGGDHEVTGTLTNGMIYVNTEENVKLRLSGANITNPNGPAICFENVDKAFITISKDTVNYLTDGSNYSNEEYNAALFSNDNLEIKGGGTLYIEGNYKHGINSDDKINIENGNIIIKAVSDAIHTNETVKIIGGTLDITADSDGIDCGEDILIEEGTFSIEAVKDGIKGITNVNITGGNFDINAQSDGIQSDSSLEISGGYFNIIAKDGISAELDIVINGGIFDIIQSKNELESNSGQVIINNGQVNITADKDRFASGGSEENLAGDIIFSMPSSTFRNQVSVTLSSKIANAEIRYTTDGSVPNGSSRVFTNTLSFTATTQLRAQAFVNGAAKGEMGTSIYIASSIDQKHDLPLLIMDAYGKGKPNREYKDVALMLMEPNNNEASVLQNPTVATRAAYHLRGQSSAKYEKAPYRIELRNNDNEDAKYPLLGMPADGDWALLSPFPDKSLMRNALAYEIGKDLGLYAPRYKFVEVYINVDNQPLSADDYQGVYILVEKIEINSKRLDIAKLEPDNLTEPDITGGYLMQFNMMAAEAPLITGNGWSDLEVSEPDDLRPEQLSWITNYIQQTHNAIHSSNPSNTQTGYPAFIDVDSYVDFIIHNELGRQPDSYIRSAKIYKDRGGKIKAGPLWDFDLAYASYTGMGGNSVEGWQFQPMMMGMGGTTCDWYNTLMQDPAFQSKISARWQELRRGPLSDAQLRAKISGLSSQLTNASKRNFQKWNNLNTSMVGGFNTQTTQTWEQQITIMQDFVIKRAAWLDQSGWKPTTQTGGWTGGGW